jgi:hypothetical protein
MEREGCGEGVEGGGGNTGAVEGGWRPLRLSYRSHERTYLRPSALIASREWHATAKQQRRMKKTPKCTCTHIHTHAHAHAHTHSRTTTQPHLVMGCRQTTENEKLVDGHAQHAHARTHAHTQHAPHAHAHTRTTAQPHLVMGGNPVSAVDSQALTRWHWEAGILADTLLRSDCQRKTSGPVYSTVLSSGCTTVHVHDSLSLSSLSLSLSLCR